MTALYQPLTTVQWCSQGPTPFDVTHGTNDKPVASESLVKLIKSLPAVNGRLFLGYPIARKTVESNCIDALWVSPDYGVVAFDLIEGRGSGDVENRHEDIANQLERRLRNELKLVHQRNLTVPVSVVTFSPISPIKSSPDNQKFLEPKSFVDYFNKKETVKVKEQDWFALTLSVLENVSRLSNGRSQRHVKQLDSRGRKLKKLEDSIATLDHQQSKAVMETVPGIQRIRGLAGSGKTIVLALKAAYLHSQNPDWIIRVTFNTRSLKQFFRQLIRDFHFEQSETEPNWDNLQIMNAWGAPGTIDRNGIYHEFCVKNDVEYMNWNAARNTFHSGQIFSRVCKRALQQVVNPQKLYDLILIDEAQDLPISFLRLCYQSLKAPNRLVYAYDELQSLDAETSLPSPEKIFDEWGIGVPEATHAAETSSQPTADLILQHCYRTSRPILVTAHALGFGVYRRPPIGSPTGLVQMFDDSRVWEAVGYEAEESEIEEGKKVTLKRAAVASLDRLEQHSSSTDAVVFKAFTTVEQQVEWVSTEIQRNLDEDELKLTDIMVINLHPRNTRENLGPIGAKLMELEIHSHFAGVDTNPDDFKLNGIESIPFSGIHRAKGNEAAMVYITNAEFGLSSVNNQISVRNRLFTAITRSKAWVRVTGIGDEMQRFEHEYTQLKAQDFKLKFRYPTAAERDELRTIHAQSDLDETSNLEGGNLKIFKLVKELENGAISKDELDPELIDRLQRLM